MILPFIQSGLLINRSLRGPPYHTKTITYSFHFRYAMIVLDFQDLCQGMHNQVNGRTALNIRLLEKSGYKVLTFPHFEFNGSDAFLRRVQYLEGKIENAKSVHLY